VYVRRLLKSLEREGRGVLAVGDIVDFKPAPDGEGLVLRVLPRKHVLIRRYRREEHIIAANVDQALIVGSLIRPQLKPTLIDRYLVRAYQGELAPVLCFNKADLVDGSQFMHLIGLYSQLGIPVILTSAITGQGIDELRERLSGRDTVLVGQSGVGKSSLLNALNPEYRLKVREISNLSRKGRHTTTTAQWLGFPGGGSVIDTPGVRQFELGDMTPAELPAYFPEFTPFLPRCRFPGCTHTEESDCGIVTAVVDRLIAASRYDSYRRILEGAEE
jgi:ribosome biogenesis GTPase